MENGGLLVDGALHPLSWALAALFICGLLFQNHWGTKHLSQSGALLGDRSLVLDRECSYEERMKILDCQHIQFVIRLNLGNQHK